MEIVSPIRAVILDYGEVLCLAPSREEFAYSARLLGMDLDSFLARYPAVRLPYDQGVLTAADYWGQVAMKRDPIAPDTLAELRRHDVAIYSRLDSVMLAWIPRLQASGIRVGLLSNMPFDMAAHARQHFRWLQGLESCILSCEHSLIKPSPEIYRLALAQLNVEPQEALFVDDRKVNTDAAEAVGLRALQFHSVDRLREDLRGLENLAIP
jgi:putative hydrolase of the HAD superfamily